MVIRPPLDDPICGYCKGTNLKKIKNPKSDKDSNIYQCQKSKCRAVVDLTTKKEDILHKLYHDHPDQEPEIRSIVSEGDNKK